MANPVLREEVFAYRDDNLDSTHVMTKTGVMLKTCILALLLAITFYYTWYLEMSGFSDKVNILRNIGIWGGLGMLFIINITPKNGLLALTTPIYAMLQGLVLGSFSAFFEKYYPGVAVQAAMGTILTVFSMLFLYSTKIIKVTSIFHKVVVISTFALFGVYILNLILSFFHAGIPGVFSNSLFGIAFSAFAIVVAAFNLVLDFNFIEVFEGKVPSSFEWYAGFSLMVTIIWMYIEFLEMLAKIQSRR